MGHHYAIWARDSNILLAQKILFGPAKGWPHFRHCCVFNFCFLSEYFTFRIEYFNTSIFFRITYPCN